MKTIPFTTIVEYISLQEKEIQPALKQLYQTIKKAAPKAEEVISYQMPAFKFYSMLAYFAVFKNHYSLFVSPNVLLAYKEKLSKYSQTKSAIHFPLNQKTPVKLVTEIIKLGVAQNLEKQRLKASAKKKTK